MPVKRLRPITPGTRFRVANAFAEITESKPEKSLTVSISKSGGRNNQGKMTMRYIGGGHKKHHSRESSDSSLFNSESSSLFGSDFDELISE